ncbi:MAG: CmpA/NrtA family ABC transporter substrate-binding protein, partial [Candidatus Woesebacteria bacterium]|nr:CmpA/NrtA family ABC transporter substrate-binding protein [Candidatus Woesebacteria bacterium]
MPIATRWWPEMDSRPNAIYTHARRTPGPLRVGFVPLVHAAPLLAAHHLGLYSRHGIDVRLSQEVGWATIREKILGGDLDAAQALAPMPIAMSLGLNSARCDCLTALVLNLHGDTVILSRRLWRESSGNPAELRGPRHADGDPLTFGIVYPHSAQAFVLRQWLGQAGLVPDIDYRLVVVPPQQMVAHLKAGHIDGGCVGEPWGSLAVRTGVGVIAALSADLAPGHAEKVLLVRRSFAEQHPAEHRALVASLLEACAWCANPDHHDQVIALLASRHGLATQPEIFRPAVTGHFDLGDGRSAHRPDALVFHGPGVNAPTVQRATWLAGHLGIDLTRVCLQSLFRLDLFEAALTNPTAPILSPV